MSPTEPTVSSLQNLDLITKMEEDDLREDSIKGRNIQVDVTDLHQTQRPTGGTYITICIFVVHIFYGRFIMIIMEFIFQRSLLTKRKNK